MIRLSIASFLALSLTLDGAVLAQTADSTGNQSSTAHTAATATANSSASPVASSPPAAPAVPTIIDASQFTSASLAVPQGQTVMVDFGNQSTLNLTGNLVNSGNIYAFTSNPNIHAANISALNIQNNQGALLSSILPGANLFGISSAVHALDLNLNAINNILNAGTISSSGNLSFTAGGTITNALPAGVTGPSPVMQAMQNLNLNSASGALTNSGVMQAMLGAINIQGTNAANLILNNTGGVLEALNSSINVRDASAIGALNTTIIDGLLSSNQLNIFSGTGDVSIKNSSLTGVLNITAGEAHSSTVGDLALGKLCLTGDPTFFSLGNIQIVGDIVVGSSLSIVAQQNIFIPPTKTVTQITANNAGQGASINIIAGANITNGTNAIVGGLSGTPPAISQEANSTVTVTGTTPSGSGGNVDFSVAGNGFLIDASSSCANCAGADVTIAAYGGVGTGYVYLPGQINTSGNKGAAGNVTVIAGAANSAGFLTQTGIVATDGVYQGQITAQGTGGGVVTVAGAQPTSSDSKAVDFLVSGSIGSGNAIVPGTTQASTVQIVDGINAAGKVAITTGSTLAVNGPISASTVQAFTGNNFVNNSNISTPIATGGDISIFANAPSFTFTNNGTILSQQNGAKSNGGALNIMNLGGNVVIPQSVNEPNEFFNVYASGDISSLAAATQLNAKAATFIAGANVTYPNLNTLSINLNTGMLGGPSATGGNINLPFTSWNTTNFDNIIAYANAGGSQGQINVVPVGTINTRGIAITSSAPTGTAIYTGNISSFTTVHLNAMTIPNTPGVFPVEPPGVFQGTTTKAAINVGDIDSGSLIMIRSSGNVSTGSLSAQSIQSAFPADFKSNNFNTRGAGGTLFGTKAEVSAFQINGTTVPNPQSNPAFNISLSGGLTLGGSPGNPSRGTVPPPPPPPPPPPNPGNNSKNNSTPTTTTPTTTQSTTPPGSTSNPDEQSGDGKTPTDITPFEDPDLKDWQDELEKERLSDWKDRIPRLPEESYDDWEARIKQIDKAFQNGDYDEVMRDLRKGSPYSDSVGDAIDKLKQAWGDAWDNLSSSEKGQLIQRERDERLLEALEGLWQQGNQRDSDMMAMARGSKSDASSTSTPKEETADEHRAKIHKQFPDVSGQEIIKGNSGKLFDTPGEALKSWRQDVLEVSRTSHREYAGLLYQLPNGQWSYTPSARGSTDESDSDTMLPYVPKEVDKLSRSVMDLHTHDGVDDFYDGEHMSPADKDRADTTRRKDYMLDPQGGLHVYLPAKVDWRGNVLAPGQEVNVK